MTQSSRNQPSKQKNNWQNIGLQGETVVLHSKLELLWRLNGEKASLLLSRLSPVNSSLFYLKIGEPRAPRTAAIVNNLLGTKRKWSCNVCVNNIVLVVTVSRYAIHHDNISNTLADLLQFWAVAFELCPLLCFRKRYARKVAKKEVADVFRCYLTNLRRFWIVNFRCVTLWPVTILQETSRLLSRRFLQDFAIYKRAHFWGMI